MKIRDQFTGRLYRWVGENYSEKEIKIIDFFNNDSILAHRRYVSE